MDLIAVIPARAGSKRIPRKCARMFHGKPILTYSIDAAFETDVFKHVYVSTEDDGIAEIARFSGAKVIDRPRDLADDVTDTQAVMRHALANASDCEIACMIYPTAPLMDHYDLLRGLTRMVHYQYLYASAIGTEPFLHDAGQFYWGREFAWRNALPIFAEHWCAIPIAAERDCDINVESDWKRAERMYAALHVDEVDA